MSLQDCDVNKFQYHLNYYCILGQDNVKTSGFLVLTLVMCCFNVYLIRESKWTKNKLLTSHGRMDTTYSIFHLRIIQFTQVYLIFTLIHLSFCVVALGFYGKYYEMILNSPGCNQKLNTYSGLSSFYFYYDEIAGPIITYFVFCVILLQCQEWWAMIYLIRTQRNRSLEEINYDFSAENVNINICKNDP